MAYADDVWRVLGVFGVIPLLACSALSGLDDFGVSGGVGAGGSLPEGGAGGSVAATGGGGVSSAGGSGGVGGVEVCVEGDLLTDPFTMRQVAVGLNSPQDDDDPTFTADGLVLVFNSLRNGQADLFEATRSNIDDDWGQPSLVTELSTAGRESNPVLAPDGLTIWFNRDPPDTMMVSTRDDRGAVWSDPVTLPLTDATAGTGAVTSDLLTMLLHTDTGFPSSKLWESMRGSTSEDWGALVYRQDLDLGANNQEPWMSRCGRHVYWSTGNIYRASRTDLASDFGTAEDVVEINMTGAVGDPWLSGDQRYMMFVVGPSNGRDIWEARR